MSVDVKDLVHENLLNFRGSSIPGKIPEHLKMESYKLLWGAGDIWILNAECFENYDIFVSFGISEYGSSFGNPPTPGLTMPSKEFMNDNEVLMSNLRKAKWYTENGHKKIIVYFDMDDSRQRNKFIELFGDKLTLFEELGVHNDIHVNHEHSQFLDKLLINNYHNTINFSALDINHDGSKLPLYLRPHRNLEGELLDSPIEIDKIGKDKIYLSAYFIESDPGIQPIILYTNPDIMNELKTYIRDFDKQSLYYESFDYIRMFVNLDELSLEELNFISVVLHNLETLIPKIFMTSKYVISFNKTPRLYSDTEILRISFHKPFSRLFGNATRRYLNNGNNGGKRDMKKNRTRKGKQNKHRKRRLFLVATRDGLCPSLGAPGVGIS